MKQYRKMLAMLLALCTLALLLAGCASSAPAAEPTAAPAEAADATDAPAATEEAAESDKEYKDELHIAMGSEPTNLDVTTNTATVATEVAYGTIFEALVAMDESYGPVAELAESWEISEDSTEYTWHLRQGVKFHNGQEMTAEDAAAGWPARATRRP